jgi:WD40 domain-containing protein
LLGCGSGTLSFETEVPGTAAIRGAALSRDGKLAAIVPLGLRSRVEILDGADGSRIERLPVAAEVTSVRFSDDGQWLFATMVAGSRWAYRDRLLRWRTRDWRIHHGPRLPGLGGCLASERHGELVVAAAFDPSRGSSSILTWAPGHGRPRTIVAGLRGKVLGLAVSRGHIAIASWAHCKTSTTAWLWTSARGLRPLSRVGDQASRLDAIAFDADGTTLVAAGGWLCGTGLQLWHRGIDGAQRPVIPKAEYASPLWLRAVAARDDGTFVAAGDGVVVWDRDGVERRRFGFDAPPSRSPGIVLCG